MFINAMDNRAFEREKKRKKEQNNLIYIVILSDWFEEKIKKDLECCYFILETESLMRKTKNVDEWWPKPDLPEIKFKEHTTKN